jgi:hypothetical protein
MSLFARNCVRYLVHVSSIWVFSDYVPGKDKKRVDKNTAQSKETEAASNQISTEDLRAALDKVKAEEVPSTPDQKEQYFMMQVSMGEQICTQGQSHTPYMQLRKLMRGGGC